MIRNRQLSARLPLRSQMSFGSSTADASKYSHVITSYFVVFK
jgi:hypothetical protein